MCMRACVPAHPHPHAPRRGHTSHLTAVRALAGAGPGAAAHVHMEEGSDGGPSPSDMAEVRVMLWMGM